MGADRLNQESVSDMQSREVSAQSGGLNNAALPFVNPGRFS
jgi:hypothetical protein